MTITAALSTALDDRYQIEREIGAGGMATVYLARDRKHDRLVALKVLRPDLAAVLGTERFLAEIRITAQLDHPHILTLIDSGAVDGFLYYVMPYVRGESLRQKLVREKQLEVEEALAIAQQVGSALDYAHRQGVVHRDIKPENILLQEGEAMLADFGIALAVREAGGNRLTQSGISLGTPQYMSPEQATGDRQLDARSDVYSLGAVLYEMLAGEPPHTGPTVQAVIAKLLTERPTNLRLLRDTVPDPIERAVAKSLAQVPADRYRSAGAFVAALRAPTPSTRKAGDRRRFVFPALAGLIIVAATVVAAVVLTRHRAAPAVRYDRVRLTSTGHAYNPIVSPDGRQVAYLDQQCPDTAACRTRIVVQDVATSAQRVIADSVSGVDLERWSPSGSWLRLQSWGTWKPAGEYVVPSLGGPMT
ncbi:MAG: protein kinase domain-containing protein, partial [Gemmatimonadaceae bacterium]